MFGEQLSELCREAGGALSSGAALGSSVLAVTAASALVALCSALASKAAALSGDALYRLAAAAGSLALGPGRQLMEVQADPGTKPGMVPPGLNGGVLQALWCVLTTLCTPRNTTTLVALVRTALKPGALLDLLGAVTRSLRRMDLSSDYCVLSK